MVSVRNSWIQTVVRDDVCARPTCQGGGVSSARKDMLLLSRYAGIYSRCNAYNPGVLTEDLADCLVVETSGAVQRCSKLPYMLPVFSDGLFFMKRHSSLDVVILLVELCQK